MKRQYFGTDGVRGPYGGPQAGHHRDLQSGTRVARVPPDQDATFFWQPDGDGKAEARGKILID